MPITDDFNRADGSPGSGWTSAGSWGIVSNAVQPSNQYTNTFLLRSEASFPNDQYAQAKCQHSVTGVGDPSRGGVAIRVSGNAGYFAKIVGATTVELRKGSPGTDTWIGDYATGSFTAGTYYTLKIEAIGSTINVYIDGTLRISVTDTTYTSGTPGIITEAGQVDKIVPTDDFECTDAGAAPVVFNPTFVAAGTAANAPGATITPALPTGIQADDILLLFVESANQAITLSSAQGFAELPSSPQGTGTAGGTTATRLAIFWKRATGSDSAPTVANPGNHTYGVILAFRGCLKSDNPWNVTTGDVAASASTSVSIPSVTTTVDNCLVVVAVANATDIATAQTSAWSNSNLSSVTEVSDGNTTSGNGGGIGIATGVKALAGSVGATSATLATSSVQGRITIALMPEPYPPARMAPLKLNPLLRM